MTRMILAAVPLAAALALSALPAAAQDEVTPADEVEPAKSVIGTLTEGEDGAWYLMPEDGDPIELQFGPSWFHELTALFDLFDGQADVTIGGNLRDGMPNENASERAKEVAAKEPKIRIKTVNDERRDQGKPPWAGGPKGNVPPGQAKKAADNVPPGQAKKAAGNVPGPGQEGRVTSGCYRDSASDRRSRPIGRLPTCPAACIQAPVAGCVSAWSCSLRRSRSSPSACPQASSRRSPIVTDPRRRDLPLLDHGEQVGRLDDEVVLVIDPELGAAVLGESTRSPTLMLTIFSSSPTATTSPRWMGRGPEDPAHRRGQHRLLRARGLHEHATGWRADHRLADPLGPGEGRRRQAPEGRAPYAYSSAA